MLLKEVYEFLFFVKNRYMREFIIIGFRTEIANSYAGNWQFLHSEIESSSRNWTNKAA